MASEVMKGVKKTSLQGQWITPVITAVTTLGVSLIGIVPPLLQAWEDKKQLEAELSHLKAGLNKPQEDTPTHLGMITGTITLEQRGHEPLSNAEVYLLPATGKDYMTVTDDTGAFVFNGVRPEAYWIVVRDGSANRTGRALIRAGETRGRVSLTGAFVEYSVDRP